MDVYGRLVMWIRTQPYSLMRILILSFSLIGTDPYPTLYFVADPDKFNADPDPEFHFISGSGSYLSLLRIRIYVVRIRGTGTNIF